MSTFNRNWNNPFRNIDRRWTPLIYGAAIGIVFAVIFFNPFTQSNIAFAIRAEPSMFPTQPANTAVLALIYFTVTGIILAGVRMLIGQRVGGPISLPIALGTMIIWSGALIYGALLLFNPALACMLESCHSTFVASYALVTVGFGTMLAYNTNSGRSSGSNNSSDYDYRPTGCTTGGGLLLTGLVLFIGGLLFTFFAVRNSSGC